MSLHINRPNNAQMQVRMPKELKEELDNLAGHRGVSPSELLRMWIRMIVEMHPLDEGASRTVHIQPELSIESMHHYVERGDLHILMETVESRLGTVKYLRKELEKEQRELEMIHDKISDVARMVLRQLEKDRKADPGDKDRS